MKFIEYYEMFKKIMDNKNAPEEKHKTSENLFMNYKTALTEVEKEILAKKSIQKTYTDFIAEDGESFAQDSAPSAPMASVFALYGSNIPDVIYSHFCAQGFIGYQACAILKQNWIINTACTVPAEDAIQPDFEIESKDDIDQEIIKDIKHKSSVKFHINDVAKNIVINKKTFGQALAIPVFSGDYDYSVPFNIDAVQPNSYLGFKLIEPYWIVPEFDNESISNPAYLHFYEPTRWRLPNNVTVHRSQCIHITNGCVPDILKPTYFYGGVPLPQMIYSRVYAAEKVANEAPMLAMTKRLYVMDGNLANISANQQDAEKQLSVMNWMRDNYGILVKNPEDQIQQIDTALADFDALIMTQYQLVASIAQMPATKLLKTTPKGFNATGEFELKDYIQSLQSLQENDMKPLIDRHLQIYSKSKYGKDLHLTAKFNPIDIPTQETKASLNTSLAGMLAQLVSAGVISPEEAREKIQSDEFAGFNFINAEDVPQEENEEDQQAIQQFLAMKQNGVSNEENNTETNNQG